jgi:DNA modification methylase
VHHCNLDPPYNIGYDGGDGWDTFPSEENYLSWCREWATEAARVLAPGRMLVVWGTQKSDLFFRLKLEVLNSIEDLFPQNPIHWSYNWGGRTKSNFPHKMETAWCYSKGEDFLFNPEAVAVPRKMKKNIRTGQDYETGTVPTTVWEGNLTTISQEAKDSRFHPTVKPQFVLQRMIKAYTLPGETVLDCFSGSGSTAVAARETGRDFLGCEKNTNYYKLSKSRIG